MNSEIRRAHASYWGISAGLYGGAAAWYADQQLVVARAYAHCSADIRGYAVTVAIVCLIVAIGSTLISWRAMAATASTASIDGHARTRRFVGLLSVGMGIIAVLGISFATLSSVFLACER
jgi:hypothetical protein